MSPARSYELLAPDDTGNAHRQKYRDRHTLYPPFSGRNLCSPGSDLALPKNKRRPSLEICSMIIHNQFDLPPLAPVPSLSSR